MSRPAGAFESLPVACYDAAGVRALDQAFMDRTGVTSDALMAWAGASAFRALVRNWPRTQSMDVFCGGGNNAGDGYVIARLALAAGWRVRVIAAKPSGELKGAAIRAAEAYQTAGGRVVSWSSAIEIESELVVDALLGTGVNRAVEGAYAEAIELINQNRQHAASVVAVDVPSGLDAGTGTIHGAAVRADLTPTFIGLKLGLLTGDAPAATGRIVFDDLGAPATIYSDHPPLATRINRDEIAKALRPRLPSAHKNRHGRLLCTGGNRGMGGAIRLSAEAALRTGSGLVSVACHPDHAAAMSQARPELMAAGIEAGDDEHSLIQAADVVVMGPGLGRDNWAEQRFNAALASAKPLLVDADGLNLLADAPRTRGDWILTPHPGEAARLLDCGAGEIARDRRAVALALAARFDAVVVLKGAGTVVACGDDVAVNTTGNAGMAVGGMGDVLAGVIGSLWGQGLSAFDAARVGVRIHGTAGDAAAANGGQRGLLPSDLFDHLRVAANPEVA